ncbi:MAG: HEAT repeat domain-containing protein [Cyanobacteria bacterium SIG29]|nr:HEAT repeat domain-containing protein [Cyanobacteria bacterium SIG29]
MEENFNIPFDRLVNDCEIISPQNYKFSIDKITALSSEYPSEYLVLIYNYFFEHSNSYEILMFLLQKIDKFKDKSSRPILIDSLLMKGKFSQRIPDADNITRIRVNITKVLANTKDSQAVYPLLYCLNSKDENYKVKLSCAEALGKIGDRYAVLPLMSILEDENESSVYVKESAVSALGMIGDEKAVDSLVSILESKKGFLDKFTFLKERALEALNKISFKGERVFRALVKSLQDESPQVRINAIEVLMNSDDSRAVDLIKNMLEDNNREVVQNAVIALYNLLGDDILDEIIATPTYSENAKTEAIKLQDDLRDEDLQEDNIDE